MISLSGSQALRLSGPCFSVAIVVGLILGVGGCDSPIGLTANVTTPTASQLSQPRSSAYHFDAGVLFANEASYLCFPIEKFGIDSTQEILTIKSSCECVRPSVVRYQRQQSEEGVALRFDFVEDSQAQDKESPVSLAVTIKLQLVSGIEQSVTIQFLHTIIRGTAL